MNENEFFDTLSRCGLNWEIVNGSVRSGELCPITAVYESLFLDKPGRCFPMTMAARLGLDRGFAAKIIVESNGHGVYVDIKNKLYDICGLTNEKLRR